MTFEVLIKLFLRFLAMTAWDANQAAVNLMNDDTDRPRRPKRNDQGQPNQVKPLRWPTSACTTCARTTRGSGQKLGTAKAMDALSST